MKFYKVNCKIINKGTFFYSEENKVSKLFAISIKAFNSFPSNVMDLNELLDYFSSFIYFQNCVKSVDNFSSTEFK